MSEKLILSDDEKRYYDNFYQRIQQKKQDKIKQSHILSLLISKANVKDHEIAEYIVNQSIKLSHSDNNNISKEAFRIVMKYLAQYQQGVNVKNINILTVNTTQYPKFPKQSVQDKIQRNKSSIIRGSGNDQDIDNQINQNNSELQGQQQQQQQQQSNLKQPYMTTSRNQDITMSIHEQKYPILNVQNNNNNNKNSDNNDKPDNNNKQQQQINNKQNTKNQKIQQNVQQDEIEENKFEQNNNNKKKNNQYDRMNDEDGFLQELDQKNKEEYQNNLSLLKSINFPDMLSFISPQAKEEKKPTIQITSYKTKELYLQKNYVVFLIQYGQSSEVVERRYKQFEELNDYFINKKEYQGRIIPKLPEKHSSLGYIFQTESNNHEFLQRRMNDLEDYLDRISKLNYLSEDPVFHQFLTENTFTPAVDHQSVITQITNIFHNISNKNFTEHSEYLQVYLAQKWNEYYSMEEQNNTINMKDIDEIMEKIIKYQKQVDHLQQIFYQQYKMQKQIVDSIQSTTENNNSVFDDSSEQQSCIFDSISNFEKTLLTQSSYYATQLIFKKAIWKNFRSISSQIDGAKQSYDMLKQKIKNQHFLNHLRAKKMSSRTRDDPNQQSKIDQIDLEIKNFEEEILSSKNFLKEDLDQFLTNLKNKITASLEQFKNQTVIEFNTS